MNYENRSLRCQHISPKPLEDEHMKRVSKILKVLRYMCLSGVVVIGLVIIVSTSSGSGNRNNAEQSGNIPWQMFHYNAQHTGQSPFYGPKNSNLKWRYTQEGVSEENPPRGISIDTNGTIYATAANKLIALNAEGNLLWSSAIAGLGTTAISNDETVIYTVGGRNLYAFTNLGGALWTFEQPTENIYGEPCIASDGTIYFGSFDAFIYALNPDGTLKWKYQTDGAIAPMASPTLSNDETTIYVASGDPNFDPGGSLYAINADGTLKWQKNLDPWRVSGAVVGPNNNIYVCGSGRIYCFSPDSTKIWESASGTASSLAPSLSSDGTIYVGTGIDGKVNAIDSSNGQTKWSYQTGTNPNYDPNNPIHPQYGVPATLIIGKNGIIYAGSVDGVMHALKPDGNALWIYQTGNVITEDCPAIGPDGSLIFSSRDKYLYAIDASTPVNAASDLSASAVSSSQIDLSWKDNSNNEAGFKIERKTGEAGTFSQIGTVGTDVTVYNDTGLSPSTIYYYWVVAYNNEGNSHFSNIANATTSASETGGGGDTGGGGGDTGGGGGGCAIVTACYGTPMAEEVKTLCTFRDQYLLTNPLGQFVVKFYYNHSPKVADFIRDKESLKAIIREYLKPFIWMIRMIVE